MKILFVLIGILIIAVKGLTQPFSLDNSFAPDLVSPELFDYQENINGTYYVSGFIPGFLNNFQSQNIIKFFPSGIKDLSYTISPPIADEAIYWISKYKDSLYVQFLTSSIYKLDNFGNRDLSFESSYSSDIGSCILNHDLYLFDDGSILVGGSGCDYPKNNPTINLWLLKILSNGKIDSTFTKQPNFIVRNFAKYDSTRIIITGGFSSYDGYPISRIARIYTDGTLDTTFSSIFTLGGVYHPYVQTDGKIICPGMFKVPGSNDTLGLVRINGNGSLDTTFNNFNGIKTVAKGGGNTICPTSDGGYLVGGPFSEYQGYPRGKIAKIDHNGYLDTTVFIGTGFDTTYYPNLGIPPYVRHIEQGANDMYYVIGHFTGYNGQPVKPIVRFHGPLGSIHDDNKNGKTITVYPNPANDMITLQNKKFIKFPLNIKIRNFFGKDISTSVVREAEVEIPIKYLTPGIYFLVMEDGDGNIHYEKIIKQ